MRLNQKRMTKKRKKFLETPTTFRLNKNLDDTEKSQVPLKILFEHKLWWHFGRHTLNIISLLLLLQGITPNVIHN